ncbi:MAG: hydrolase [Deltaproteobacteria bacterium]|jgi:hypothetical protein|nr:hydrolase [Deltaproteobacteria bacterium]
MRILPEHTQAIAVDYQEKLIPAIADKELLITNSKILLAGLELLNIPVLVSRQYPKGLGDTVEEIRAVTGKAKILDKSTFSCYQDAGIKQAVDQAGRKNVLICGTEAHVCVLQTAVDLLEAGYNVFYVVDCAGSRKAGDKKFGVKRALREGALPVTYESVLFELTAAASSPVFKDISRLVK